MVLPNQCGAAGGDGAGWCCSGRCDRGENVWLSGCRWWSASGEALEEEGEDHLDVEFALPVLAVLLRMSIVVVVLEACLRSLGLGLFFDAPERGFVVGCGGLVG